MDDVKRICPKCNGEMESGELVDEAGILTTAQSWARRASSLMRIGMTVPLRITSYRCVECGFLENYATDPEKDRIPVQMEMPKELRS